MRLISRSTLREFWTRYADSEQPLKAWAAEVERANWLNTAEIKARYPSASIVDSERIVFNIGGNKYRLIVKVWFAGQTVFVKFVGTHAEYDRIDVEAL